MQSLSRRSLMAAAAVPLASPPFVISALANAAPDPSIAANPDAELLALGTKLESIIQEWLAYDAECKRYTAAWEAACERAGLPRLPKDTVYDEAANAYDGRRSEIKPSGDFREAEVDQNGADVVWNDISDRLFPMCE